MIQSFVQARQVSFHSFLQFNIPLLHVFAGEGDLLLGDAHSSEGVLECLFFKQDHLVFNFLPLLVDLVVLHNGLVGLKHLSPIDPLVILSLDVLGYLLVEHGLQCLTTGVNH